MALFDKILKRKKRQPESAKNKVAEISVGGATKEETKKEIPAARGEILVGVLRVPHVTEKTTNAASNNKYVFSVSPDANKITVKRAVEGHYGVGVEKVNVLNTVGKERKRGKQIGWKPGFKKAIVTVKEGESIEVQ